VGLWGGLTRPACGAVIARDIMALSISEHAIALDCERVYAKRPELDHLLDLADRKNRAQQLLRRAREEMGARAFSQAVATLDEVRCNQ
jgi:hypothetical protein